MFSRTVRCIGSWAIGEAASANGRSSVVHTLAFIGITLLTVPVARADWAGKGELGVLISRGNAEATSGNGKLDLSKESGLWKNSALLGMLYGKNASFTTAQRLEARWQTDYKLTERLFAFGALRGEQDRFSGFSYQASATTGLGYKFVDSDDLKLTGTLGVGYRRLQPETLIKSPAGEVLQRIKGDATGDAVVAAGVGYEQKLTASTKLFDKLLVESGSSNTTAQNDFAVQVSVNEVLALSFGYGIRYNTDPPSGRRRSIS